MTAGDTTETQRDDLWSTIVSLLPALWLPLCGVFIVAFVYAAASRLAYPYPLEWLEPGAAGLCRAELRLCAVDEEPLYYYVVAAFSPIFGNGLRAGRVVSLLAICGVCWLIWLFVRREGGSRLWATYGVAFVLATYHIAHDWYDIARLDSFYLLLTLAAAFLLRFGSGMRGAAAAGLVFALAFFTKQAVLMLMIPVLLLDAFAERRRALTASAVATALIVLSLLALHLASDGWSTFFLIEVPRHVVIEPDRVTGFWTSDIAVPLALALLASLGWILHLWFADRATALFYTGLLGGALLIGWAGRANIAGSPNVLMPAYAVFASHCRSPYRQRCGVGAMAAASRKQAARAPISSR